MEAEGLDFPKQDLPVGAQVLAFLEKVISFWLFRKSNANFNSPPALSLSLPLPSTSLFLSHKLVELTNLQIDDPKEFSNEAGAAGSEADQPPGRPHENGDTGIEEADLKPRLL